MIKVARTISPPNEPISTIIVTQRRSLPPRLSVFDCGALSSAIRASVCRSHRSLVPERTLSVVKARSRKEYFRIGPVCVLHNERCVDFGRTRGGWPYPKVWQGENGKKSATADLVKIFLMPSDAVDISSHLVGADQNEFAVFTSPAAPVSRCGWPDAL